MNTMRRSMLFIPGNNPSMIINGHVFGSDSIIYDLEDAVSPKEKDGARILVRNVLRSNIINGVEKIVRINGLDTEYWKEDLRQIIPAGIDAILLPKTESEEDIYILLEEIDRLSKEIDRNFKEVKVLPLLESAIGIENAFEIGASSNRVIGLFLGAEDLTSNLGANRTKKGDEIFYSRSRIIIAAKANNIDAIDTPFTDIDDIEGLKYDTKFVRDIGFTGKSIINPRHIDYVNTIFTPEIEEYEYARRVILTINRAEKEGRGVVSLDGKMIDAPIVDRAKQVIDMWNKIKGGINNE